MSRFKLYFSIFSLCFHFCNTQISDKRLCIDAECSRPVSNAKTLIKYFAKDSYHLSFEPNEKVVIYSKSAGSRKNLWGVEIGGKRGYVPKELVRETKVFEEPLVLVDTEASKVSDVPQVPEKKESVKPSKVKENYEVIDGTTIYIHPDDDSTEETQGQYVESLTEKSDSSINNLKNIELTVNKEVDGVENETLKNEAREIYLDTANKEDTYEENANSRNANDDQNKKDLGLSENDSVEMNIEFFNSEKSDVKLQQPSEMNDTKGKKELEDDEKINIQIESKQSSHTDSDENGNFTGIFGNVLEMVMNAIDGKDGTEDGKDGTEDGKDGTEDGKDGTEDGKDGTEDKETVEEIEAIPDRKSEINDWKSKASSESNLQEFQESFSERSEKKTVDTDQIMQENVSQNEETLERNTEKKYIDENFSKATMKDKKEVITSNALSQDNETPKIEILKSAEDKGIKQVLNSPELFDIKTNSVEHSTANYEKIFIEEQKTSFGENEIDYLKKSTKVTQNFDEDRKSSEDSYEQHQYKKKMDAIVKIDSTVENPVLPDSDVSLHNEPLLAKTNRIHPFPFSNQHKFENESANDDTSEQIVDTVYKYEKSNQNIEELDALEGDNPTPSVSDEIDRNQLENQHVGSIETSNKSNEIKAKYSPTTDFEQVQKSSMESNLESDVQRKDNFNKDEVGDQEAGQNVKVGSLNNEQINAQHSEKSVSIDTSINSILENDNGYGNSFKKDAFEGQHHEGHLETNENEQQEHESKDDTDVLGEASGIFSFLENRDNDPNFKVSNSNSDNTQNSEELVNIDASIKRDLESNNDNGDKFKYFEIQDEDEEERGNFEIEENNRREHNIESNSGVFQESPSKFAYFGNSVDQKEEVGISNKNKMNTPYFEEITNADVDVEQEKNFIGSFFVIMDLPILSSEFFLYLVTTAVSVIIFLLGYFALDKSRREAPLVAKINKLENEFLILLKEKELLSEEIENGVQNSEYVESQDFLNLQKQYEVVIKEKQALMEEIQTLEKELENSTEVGLELNRMLSDILSSENAGSILMSNIEGLQAQLSEQQGIVSSMKETLNLKETENHELHLELEIANKKVVELQSELDRLLLNIIKIEEEKDLHERNLESEITQMKEKIDSLTKNIRSKEEEYTNKTDELKNKLCTSERNLQLKMKEFEGLKISVQQIKHLKNGNNLESLLEVNSIKAELEQLKIEYHSHCDKLRHVQETNMILEGRAKSSADEAESMKKRFDEVDKARLELETKLQVLTNYFKEKEAQLQRELSKYESMWSVKQGEATSTSERIKYLQSEVQNYKTQNESLKQEIVSQEVELKSQISLLEKKVHENWVSGRQAERRLEDLKQEAANLRNRLTLRERALQEDKMHNRIQSPLEQKVDLPVSPLHLDSPSSPPLLYDTRDHITKSPPILGMPPPFLPPPPGNPFLPPPHLPFMPPPLPDMFPGDRRPPPLGRMSSPPLNSRYSPDRENIYSYSPYERRSPSPSYDESEYATSPVRHRRYSPFSNRGDHRRIGRVNGRSGEFSSGSGNSNESINGLNSSNTKV